MIDYSPSRKPWYLKEETPSVTHESDRSQTPQPLEDDLSTPLTRCGRTQIKELNSKGDIAQSTDYSSIAPFRFLNCEANVRNIILQHALVRKNRIVPMYNATSVEVENAWAHWEDRDISLLLAFAGNGALYEEALTVLYGGNTFEFYDAQRMLWWLQRIGDNSTSKLRHVAIHLNAGLLEEYMFPIRLEKLWYNTLVWYKPRQRLSSLGVSFVAWPDFPAHSPEISGPRLGVVRTLLGFRGLEDTYVESGPWLHVDFAYILADAMRLPEGANSPDAREFEEMIKEDRPKWSMA